MAAGGVIGRDRPRTRPEPQRSRASTGRLGELAAALYLERSGWRIVARNERIAGVEVDIVACPPAPASVIVIVEVRSRSTRGFASGVESVDARKVRRLYLAAAAVRSSGLAACPTATTTRVDLISIVRRPPGRWAVVEHVRGLEPP